MADPATDHVSIHSVGENPNVAVEATAYTLCPYYDNILPLDNPEGYSGRVRYEPARAWDPAVSYNAPPAQGGRGGGGVCVCECECGGLNAARLLCAPVLQIVVTPSSSLIARAICRAPRGR